MNTETIPIMRIYKKNGQINCDFAEDCQDFELYGFLKILLKDMEEKLELKDNGMERF